MVPHVAVFSVVQVCIKLTNGKENMLEISDAQLKLEFLFLLGRS